MAALAYIPAERFTRQQLRRAGEQTGLFRFLSEGSATFDELANLLGWPQERCRQWLGQLESAGLIERYEEFYWSKVSLV